MSILLPATPLVELGRQAAAALAERFGRRATHLAAAPGRVNLIGEHTDYNAGHVLPMAIDRYTVLAAAEGAEPTRVRIASAAYGETAEFALADPIATGPPPWSNYVRGVVEACRQREFCVPGFDAVVLSSVPPGGGLSSSAALEVATATLLEQLAGKSLDPVQKALACQWAEHEYAAVPCGIMDQYAAVLSRRDCLLLLDCRSGQVRHVPLADPAVAVLVINSNVRHDLATGEYARRRRECREAAQVLGVDGLCTATSAAVSAARDRLSPAQFRRARHAVEENRRTLAAAVAAEAGDWPQVGQLMNESHASLRDDFEVSCPQVDLLVSLAQDLGAAGVYGARMTGGGFGGCIVGLVRADGVKSIAARVCAQYERQTGILPTPFATRPAAGAQALPVE